MRLPRLLPSVLAILVSSAAHAEPPTARYASVQIDVARAELEHARAAAALGEAADAARLAWSAQLDARIGWAMSDSALLHTQAADIAQASARFIHGIVLKQASATQ
jgi:hypothetical protein